MCRSFKYALSRIGQFPLPGRGRFLRTCCSSCSISPLILELSFGACASEEAEGRPESFQTALSAIHAEAARILSVIA